MKPPSLYNSMNSQREDPSVLGWACGGREGKLLEVSHSDFSSTVIAQNSVIVNRWLGIHVGLEVPNKTSFSETAGNEIFGILRI